MANNESFFDKINSGSRKIFTGIGNIAVGNPINDNNKKGNLNFAPFSLALLWLYEKPMPKRK